MSYKKDQGRYARMAAFWALFLLVAYGCLSSLVYTLRGLLAAISPSLVEPWIGQFPLIGKFDLAMLISLAVLAAAGLVIYRLLNRPRSADMLIDTESELKKVTWPSSQETWNGSIAVIVTVLSLLLYLTVADFVLFEVLTKVMGR